MELIRIIISFSAILLTGYTILSIICHKHKTNLFEGIGLVMSLGSGTLGILLFWLALIGVKPSFQVMLSIFCLSAIISGSMVYLKKSAKFAIPAKLKKSEAPILSIALIILIALFSIVVIHSVMLPMFDTDSYALWGLKSKALIHEGLIDGRLFTKLPLSYSHLNYPLMVPFLMSSVYCAAYETNDIISKLIFPFLYIALSFTIYATLRWRLSRKLAIIISILFLSLPALIRWTGAGYADVPLTLFYAASIHYLVKYLKEQQKPDFILALLFTLFASFCKNEGLAIAGINIAVFVFFNSFFPFKKEKLLNSAYFAMGICILMIPWFIWSHGIPHSHENYTQRLSYLFKPENIKRIISIIEIFIIGTFSRSAMLRWGIIWIILPIAAIINYRKFKEKYVIAMWVLFILHIVAYFAVFIIAPRSPAFLADYAFERIYLHASPAIIYLIAYHMSNK